MYSKFRTTEGKSTDGPTRDRLFHHQHTVGTNNGDSYDNPMYAGVDGVYKNPRYAESGTVTNEPSHSTSMESDKKVVASHKHVFCELLYKLFENNFSMGKWQ